MAYIPPNSDIKLLAGVPIDKSYEHTLYFGSAISQYEYFSSKAVITLSNNYYVRKEKGYLKVQAKEARIYDCNYLMFRNTSYVNKWFYAFCTVEYINDETCGVRFQIDPLQTWLLDMVLGECFVEREHSLTDNIGDNLIPENLEVGEYLYTPMQDMDLGNMYIVVATTVDYDASTDTVYHANGVARGGLYSGVLYKFFSFDNAGVNSLNTWINHIIEKTTTADGIVAMFMCPDIFTAANVTNQYTNNTWAVSLNPRPNIIDGYVPKNKKLLTAPYQCMVVKTPTNIAEFAYEYFSDPNNPHVEVTPCLTPQPSILLEPYNYKNGGNGENIVEGMTLTGWPQCAFNIDTYKAWLAQNNAILAVNGVIGVAGLGLTLASGYNPGGVDRSYLNQPVGTPNIGYTYGASYTPNYGGILSSLSTVGNLLAQVYQHSLLPPQAKGNIDANAELVRGRYTFSFLVKHIRAEFAKIIDDYFTKYGYACHQLKVPNIFARHRWTYVKTVDCIVNGFMPADDGEAIQNIFNKGITFWVNANDVGNYSLDNSPLY